MNHLRLVILGIVVGVMGCSDDTSAPPEDYVGTGKTDASTDSSLGDSATSNFCWDYCNTIASKGAGCSTYNQGNRCVTNCEYYKKGACQTEWQGFASCVTGSKGIECMAQDVGYPILVTVGCQEESKTFHNCVVNKDAGFCEL